MTARAIIAVMADDDDRRTFDAFNTPADYPPAPDWASGSPQRGQLPIGALEAASASLSRQRGQREGSLGIEESPGESTFDRSIPR
jgi:hypothetical protein